jgi:hypothetical protein
MVLVSSAIAPILARAAMLVSCANLSMAQYGVGVHTTIAGSIADRMFSRIFDERSCCKAASVTEE